MPHNRGTPALAFKGQFLTKIGKTAFPTHTACLPASQKPLLEVQLLRWQPLRRAYAPPHCTYCSCTPEVPAVSPLAKQWALCSQWCSVKTQGAQTMQSSPRPKQASPAMHEVPAFPPHRNHSWKSSCCARPAWPCCNAHAPHTLSMMPCAARGLDCTAQLEHQQHVTRCSAHTKTCLTGTTAGSPAAAPAAPRQRGAAATRPATLWPRPSPQS